MWQSFDQVFGKRWTENFGNDPLGRHNGPDGKPNPRMVLWIDSLKYISWPQLKLTINKIISAPKPEVWWLPDLQTFKQFAGTAAHNQLPPEPEMPPPTWVTKLCNGYLLRLIHDFGPFSEASITRLVAAKNAIQDSYNGMMKEGEIPNEWTPEEGATITMNLKSRFARVQVDPATPEELAMMPQKMLGPRALPTKESSSSPTPTGSLGADVLSNSD